MATITIDGVTYTSAVVAPTVASTYAVVKSRKVDTLDRPTVIAEAMAAEPPPDMTRSQVGRIAAAYNRVPLYSCTAETRVLAGPEGERVGGHGTILPRKAGDPCDTKGCKGVIRAE